MSWISELLEIQQEALSTENLVSLIEETQELSGGIKFDYDKTRMDLVSPLAVEAVAKVATMGSRKYGDRNWEQGMDFSRVLGALLRHVNAWHSGERTDPESGHSHMAHAAWNAMALIHYELTGTGTDDLPRYGPSKGGMHGPKGASEEA